MGVPSAADLERAVPGLAERARAHLAACADPYTFCHTIEIDAIEGDTVRLAGGTELESSGLARRLATVKAHALTAVAWTVGSGVDDAVTRLWAAGLYDESYALDAMAAALVEQMRTMECARLCGALAPYSPGYDGWPLENQIVLYDMLAAVGGKPFTDRVSCLDSGMLLPKKSQLAVVGLTHFPALVPQAASACNTCTLPRCEYRRSDYPVKALERWSRELLKLDGRDDGGIDAHFHFEGSTCSGIPLAIDFEVQLERNHGQWWIAGGRYRPAPCDRGCERMCRAADQEGRTQPLVGEPLAAALTWNPQVNPAGCICGREQLDHKWRIAYHTIAFALEKYETPA
jgi:hypothetical protein